MNRLIKKIAFWMTSVSLPSIPNTTQIDPLIVRVLGQNPGPKTLQVGFIHNPNYLFSIRKCQNNIYLNVISKTLHIFFSGLI